MPITETQRENRVKHIGSSDVAAILGLSPKRNAYDVWLEKTGKVEPEDLSGKDYIQDGNLFEDGVLKFVENELGPIIRNQYRSNPRLHLGVHIDAILRDCNVPIEVKVTGVHGPIPPYDRGKWGEEGTDNVPDRHIVQCHAHMLAMNGGEPEVCHLGAFIGGCGKRLYLIRRSKDLCSLISEVCPNFWDNHVLKDIPPANLVPNLEVIRRAKRQPNKTIVMAPDLWDALEEAKSKVKAAEKKKNLAESALLTALGDADAADLGDGRTMTYFEQTRNGIDTKAMRKAHPEIAKDFATTSAYRVLRVKKGGV